MIRYKYDHWANAHQQSDHSSQADQQTHLSVSFLLNVWKEHLELIFSAHFQYRPVCLTMWCCDRIFTPSCTSDDSAHLGYLAGCHGPNVGAGPRCACLLCLCEICWWYFWISSGSNLHCVSVSTTSLPGFWWQLHWLYWSRGNSW